MLNDNEFLIIKAGATSTLFMLEKNVNILRAADGSSWRGFAERSAGIAVPHWKLKTGRGPAEQLDVVIEFLRVKINEAGK